MKTDDSLLQRYREANDIDTARPSPAWLLCSGHWKKIWSA